MAARARRLWAAILMSGCGARPLADAPAPAPPVVAAAEVAPAVASDRVRVWGRLRAHDGSALREAQVEIRRAGFQDPAFAIPVAADGSFELAVEPGTYVISIAAADHAVVRRSAVVTGELTVEGELDPPQGPPPGGASRLSWRGEQPTIVALRAFDERWSAKIAALQHGIPHADGKIPEPTPEHRAALAALSAEALREVAATEDPALRDLLRLAHVSTFARASDPADIAGKLDDLAFVVEHVAPDDVHLSLLHSLDHRLFEAMAAADPALVSRAEDWLDRRARLHPEPMISLHALVVLIEHADRRRDDARIAELYQRVLHERFEGATYRTILEQRYDPERRLQRGKQVADFQLAALRPSDAPIESADLMGRVYLLEFWATWCEPCVAEMPKLHEAYAELNGARPGKGKGEAALRRLQPIAHPKVEFVFVSLDQQRADVDAFRRAHWAMPWTHAFVGSAGEREVMERFGFSGVPTAILVDEVGTILEVGEALRGDALLPTIERILAERGRT